MKIDDKTIIMADDDFIHDYSDIEQEFMLNVFGLESNGYLVADESALSDFAGCCAPNDYTFDRRQSLNEFYIMCRANTVKVIKEKYGIDVDPHDYLITVFEQIKQSRNIQ